MNAFAVPGAPAWFNFALDLSLQAAVLAALVWCVVKLMGRWIPPAWRALLWFLVIARVLIPWSPESVLSIQNLFPKSTPPIAARRIVPIATQALQSITPTIDITTLSQPSEPNAAPTAILNAAESHPSFTVGTILAYAYAIAALSCLVLLLARSLTIRVELLRNKFAPSDAVLKIFAECCAEQKLHQPVRITCSEKIAAPALTGLIPTRLIVPTNFAPPQFTPEQIRQILRHELAHVQQGHLVFHWLGLIARAIHWFNPAIHFAASRLRQECELAADAIALRNSNAAERAAYGETILQVLTHVSAPPTLLALGMAEHARHLQQRLRALTSPAKRSFHSIGFIVTCAIATFGLTAATGPKETTIAPPITAEQIATNQSDTRLTSHARNIVAAPTPANGIPNRRNLYRKLETIRFDEFALPNETDLVTLLKNLNDELRKRDPTGVGVNLIISQAADKTSATRPIDVEQFKIQFKLPLRDVTLQQLFHAIVTLAKPPTGAPSSVGLRYSVEDYAVVFSANTSDSPQFFSRTYRVDPNTFRQGLEGVSFTANPFQGLATNPGGGPQTVGPGGFFTTSGSGPETAGSKSYVKTVTNLSKIQSEVRAFFSAAGVDFPTNNIAVGTAVPAAFGQGGAGQPQQKALFFNDRTGILFVRASLSDLGTIENAVHVLNSKGNPPQVRLDVRIYNVSPAELPGAMQPLFAMPLAPNSLTNVTNFVITPSVAAKFIENARTAQGVVTITNETAKTAAGKQVRIGNDGDWPDVGDTKITVDAIPSLATGFHGSGLSCVVTATERLESEANSSTPRFRVRQFGPQQANIPPDASQLICVPVRGMHRTPVLSDVPVAGHLFDVPTGRVWLILITPKFLLPSGG